MQSRQTFMAAMGGVDPGEEAFGEYDEARRRPARPPPSLCSCVALRTCVRPGAGRVHGRAVVIQAVGRACLCTVCARPPSHRRAAARQRRVSVVRVYDNTSIGKCCEPRATFTSHPKSPAWCVARRRPPARGAPAQSLHPGLADCVHYRAAHVCTHMPCYCAVP